MFPYFVRAAFIGVVCSIIVAGLQRGARAGTGVRVVQPEPAPGGPTREEPAAVRTGLRAYQYPMTRRTAPKTSTP